MMQPNIPRVRGKEEKMKRSPLRTVVTLTVLACAIHTSVAHASWTTHSLPNLPQMFGSYRVDHLSDGRFVYGTNNALYQQDSFGSGAYTQFVDSGSSTFDPSFVAVASNTQAAVGQGTFGASNLLLLNPSTTTSQAFTPLGTPAVSMQNYSGMFWNGSNMLIGGGNGTTSNGFGGQMHSINYVSADGTTNKIIIDDISLFSGDFAVDSSGDLYVSDNDDLNLYKFTQAQINSAISGTALSITDGTLVTTLAKNGSIAVDSQGRIWSAGFQTNGIDAYDPDTGLSRTFTPGEDNSNYIVSTFSDGADDYVAFINADGTNAGAAVSYGYDMTDNLAVPEPSTVLLFFLGGCAVFRVYARRKHG